MIGFDPVDGFLDLQSAANDDLARQWDLIEDEHLVALAPGGGATRISIGSARTELPDQTTALRPAKKGSRQ
jgi:hypothetical protein